MAKKIRIRCPRKKRGSCGHTIEKLPLVASGEVEKGFTVTSGECEEFVQGKGAKGKPFPAAVHKNYSANGAEHWILVFDTKAPFTIGATYRLRVFAEDSKQQKTKAHRVFKFNPPAKFLDVTCYSHSPDEDITEEAENFVAYGGLDTHALDAVELTKHQPSLPPTLVTIVHSEGGSASDGYWSAHFAPLPDNCTYDLTGREKSPGTDKFSVTNMLVDTDS